MHVLCKLLIYRVDKRMHMEQNYVYIFTLFSVVVPFVHIHICACVGRGQLSIKSSHFLTISWHSRMHSLSHVSCRNDGDCSDPSVRLPCSARVQRLHLPLRSPGKRGGERAGRDG